MKKVLIKLALTMCLTMSLLGCSDKNNNDEKQEDSKKWGLFVSEEVLAEAVNVEDYLNVPDNAIQDFCAWAQKAMYPFEREGEVVYQLIEEEATLEYAKALSEQMGLILGEVYEEDRYFVYGYTHPNVETQGDYTSGDKLSKPYPIVLEITFVYGYATLVFDQDVFTLCDMGYRMGGKEQNLLPQGESVGEALIKTSDGVYKTADGRLETRLNEAMVLRDGVEGTADVRHMIVDEEERLMVEFYYRNEGFYLEVPKYYSMTGDIYGIRELIQISYPTNTKEGLFDADFEGKVFMLCHNDRWKGPVYDRNCIFEDLSVRVMYYERDVEAVYYVYAKLSEGTPSEIEALVAADLSEKKTDDAPASDVAISDEVIELKDGDTLLVGQTGEIEYGRREFGSDYHTYSWSVVKGKDCVTIDEEHDSCKVTGRQAGEVTISVTYSYTEEGENVLTGRPESDPEYETKRFDIKVE